MSAGKFPQFGSNRFLVKGVSYGTFEPDANGWQYPASNQVATDFGMMAEAGVNTVRLYTPPPDFLLDEAARHGLKLMVGLPWLQDVAFLDDASLCRQIRRDVERDVRRLAGHEAVMLFAIGNEVPSSIVRWHGRERFEGFLGDLYQAAKGVAPDRLVTYVNYPPTDYLDLPFLDVVAFNVYLHRECDLRAYLARLHHVAGNRPLLLAEAGADAFRNGEDKQAALTAMQLRAAFEEGAWGAIAFNWTDEWWRGGHDVEDWSFGLVDRNRRPKPALAEVSRVFADVPFDDHQRESWPKVSVVVCVHNAADSLSACLAATDLLDYPDFEVLVIDDGSTDNTATIAEGFRNVTLIKMPHAGLSVARNVGLSRATGEIVAYLDGDARPEPDWLSYLVQPFLRSNVVGAGGPNVVPADDPWFSQCVARAPGGPQHVLLDDRVAEHVPGCNMAFRRTALLALEGFNPRFVRAGDDVDLCWRLQARGWEIGFAPSALVWHQHRTTLKGYWKQQVGYGESEAWLKPLHPSKFMGRSPIWQGHIYSALPYVRALRRSRVNTGVWGSAAFPSVYRIGGHALSYLPHSGRWQVASLAILLFSVGLLFTPFRSMAFVYGFAGAAGMAVTIGKCFGYAFKTDIESLPGVRRSPRLLRRLFYRGVLAGLHFIQPLARSYGRVKGSLIPPLSHREAEPTTRVADSAPARPLIADTAQSVWMMAGASTHLSFWSEQRVTVEPVLANLTDWLRLSRAVDAVELDDGWRNDRDLRVITGQLVCFDLRAVVEDHGEGKSLLRVATRVRPTQLGGFVAGAALVAAGAAVLSALGGSLGLTVVGIALLTVAMPATIGPIVKTAGVIQTAIAKVTEEMQMTPLSARDARRNAPRVISKQPVQRVEPGISVPAQHLEARAETDVVR